MKYLVILLLISFSGICGAANIQNGADQIETLISLINNKRIALVANQTSLIGSTHLLDTLCSLGQRPVALFAPEHGLRGKADAGETVKDGKDVKTGTPIISLYGKNKKPSATALADIDMIVFDIQDVGARFYTYISTLYYVMQACAENGKELVVLDRPNPCDYVDGPILKKEYKSFVGMLPIPVLHGCTMGELAGMINGEGWLGSNMKCNYSVIKIKGWKHGDPYSLPVKPSPNLPNDQSIALYASLCLFEATSVSVGRGTYFPFQVIGSPLLPKDKYPFSFTPKALEGFDKNPLHKNTECHGIDLRNTDAKQLNGFSLKYVIEMYNEFKKMNKSESFLTRPKWFDLLMGTNQVRLDMLNGKSEKEIRSAWLEDLNKYKEMRKKYMLY
ncbi:DUF1343 domain-containing protein [Bacteroides sp. ET336]|uniref:exo-beta-N-acetylmuramidase NamZ family protein n=1 Tax=Bacteroides sp. ET336 TaxID=2972459 RepID=UPI0021ABEFF1|nr:DUF1343 domain-containing protein [Bacteroides sp. ET336]MCR8893772.1 DUF1343 domain-containing protein [Bacteroides sp. ET336]MDN0058269.1 DUF1343 domain-containing protein [Bacteroides caecigallinarum]